MTTMDFILGGVWLTLFIAWAVVLILWLFALFAYSKNYREYKKTHGKHYQSPCEKNKLTRLTLQFLRRLALLLGNENVNGGLRKFILHAVCVKRNVVQKLLKLANVSLGKNPLPNLRLIGAFRKLFRGGSHE